MDDIGKDEIASEMEIYNNIVRTVLDYPRRRYEWNHALILKNRRHPHSKCDAKTALIYSTECVGKNV